MRVSGDNGTEVYMSDFEAVVTLKAANSRLKLSKVSVIDWSYEKRFAFLLFITTAKIQILESLDLTNHFKET